MLQRSLFFLYGILCYLVFLPTFLYAVGFVGNYRLAFGDWTFVPKSMDVGDGGQFWTAFIVDLLLLGLFAVQHSVMARQGFKRWWTRIIPPQLERSTYVLASSLALIVLFYFWRPLGGIVWDLEGNGVRTLLVALSLLGWSVVLLSTFLINHFELFGLQQIHAHLTRREMPAPRFVTPFLYKLVRHPLYLGFVIAFWATPSMTVGHLVFSIATTAYMVLAIQFEERDLVRVFGDVYRSYQRNTPMLVPGAARKPRSGANPH